jgi:hypothetical protein
MWRYQKVVRLTEGTKVRIGGTPAINTKVEAERVEREHILRVLHPTVAEREEVPHVQDVRGGEVAAGPPDAAGNRKNTMREKEFHLRVYLIP